MIEHQIVGAAEIVDFPEFESMKIPARIDTGARTSAMHCLKIRLLKTGNGELLCFWLQFDPAERPKRFSTRDFQERDVRSSFGEVERRYTVRALVVIRGKKIRGKFTLANRSKMSYPVLIGRNFLKRRFLVDVTYKKQA